MKKAWLRKIMLFFPSQTDCVLHCKNRCYNQSWGSESELGCISITTFSILNYLMHKVKKKNVWRCYLENVSQKPWYTFFRILLKRKLLPLLSSLICTCSIKVYISLKINKKVWGLCDFSMVINFTFMDHSAHSVYSFWIFLWNETANWNCSWNTRFEHIWRANRPSCGEKNNLSLLFVLKARGRLLSGRCCEIQWQI